MRAFRRVGGELPPRPPELLRLAPGLLCLVHAALRRVRCELFAAAARGISGSEAVPLTAAGVGLALADVSLRKLGEICADCEVVDFAVLGSDDGGPLDLYCLALDSKTAKLTLLRLGEAALVPVGEWPCEGKLPTECALADGPTVLAFGGEVLTRYRPGEAVVVVARVTEEGAAPRLVTPREVLFSLPGQRDMRSIVFDDLRAGPLLLPRYLRERMTCAAGADIVAAAVGETVTFWDAVDGVSRGVLVLSAGEAVSRIHDIGGNMWLLETASAALLVKDAQVLARIPPARGWRFLGDADGAGGTAVLAYAATADKLFFRELRITVEPSEPEERDDQQHLSTILNALEASASAGELAMQIEDKKQLIARKKQLAVQLAEVVNHAVNLATDVNPFDARIEGQRAGLVPVFGENVGRSTTAYDDAMRDIRLAAAAAFVEEGSARVVVNVALVNASREFDLFDVQLNPIVRDFSPVLVQELSSEETIRPGSFVSQRVLLLHEPSEGVVHLSVNWRRRGERDDGCVFHKYLGVVPLLGGAKRLAPGWWIAEGCTASLRFRRRNKGATFSLRDHFDFYLRDVLGYERGESGCYSARAGLGSEVGVRIADDDCKVDLFVNPFVRDSLEAVERWRRAVQSAGGEMVESTEK